MGAISYLNGGQVIVDKQNRSLMNVEPNAVCTLEYQVANQTPHRLTVIGAKTSCSCTVVDDLPLIIEAFEKKSVSIKITAPDEPTRLTGDVVLYTDSPRCPSLKLGYGVEVSSSQAKP